MLTRLLFTMLAVAVLLPQIASAEPPTKNVVFATVGEHELKLDLYLPDDVESPPLVVFIHGGGWRKGSYKSCRTQWLTEHGFAVASVSYRLTDKGAFPIQAHDCKGAIRWLRAHAKEYGYNADKVGVAGTSAGGHLSLVMGTTADNEVLEGTVGGNNDQSSRVQAVVDFFGPSDFVARSKNQPSKTELPDSPVFKLLGGAASKNVEQAKLASPAWQVTKDDAPLLIIHGDEDKTVSLAQSKRIEAEYKKAGLPVTLEVIAGAGHGGKACFSPQVQKKVAAFLNEHLR